MRTNIDIDDQLLSRAMRATGLKTKRGVVEEGLRLVVKLKQQEAVLDLPGKVHWQGDLAASRSKRATR
jgi:Arc/MetJ family transcription regulator